MTNGLTLNSAMTLASTGSNTYLYFNGTQALSGTGEIVFGGTSSANYVYAQGGNTLATAATLTTGPDITISGSQGGTLGGYYQASYDTLVNQGTIDSGTSGKTITIDAGWNNSGGLEVGSGATLNLGGTFTIGSLGTFSNTGGTVDLTGTLNNAGNTLTLNAASGSWNLVGGTVNGGTVSESGGAELVPTNSGGTLSGVTMNGPLDLGGSGANTAPQVNVTNGLTLNNSTIYVGNAAGSTYGRVYFQGNETLGGTGTVLLGKNGNNELYLNSSGNTLTIGAGITIHGSYGVLTTGSSSAIVNQGTISADDSGGVAGNFIYDTGYSGGETQSTAYAVNTSGVSNPAPQAVYQTERYYGTFSYTLANLTPAAAYTLQLDFADLLSELPARTSSTSRSTARRC